MRRLDDKQWHRHFAWMDKDRTAHGLFAAVVDNLCGVPINHHLYAVTADRLEEIDETDWAFTLRWLAGRGHHPAYRSHRRARKQWAWFRAVPLRLWPEDKAIVLAQPGSVLPRYVWLSLTHQFEDMALFETAWWAFLAVHLGLLDLRETLSFEAVREHR